MQVRLTIQVQIAIPVVLGVASLVYGNIVGVVGGLIMLALAGLAALGSYLWSVPPFFTDSIITDLARAQLSFLVGKQRNLPSRSLSTSKDLDGDVSSHSTSSTSQSLFPQFISYHLQLQ